MEARPPAVGRRPGPSPCWTITASSTRSCSTDAAIVEAPARRVNPPKGG